MHKHSVSAIEIFLIASLLSSGFFLIRAIASTKGTLGRIDGTTSDIGPIAIAAHEVYVGESITLAQLLVPGRSRVCVELAGPAVCPRTAGLIAVTLCPGVVCAQREGLSITKGGVQAIRILSRAVQQHHAVFVDHFGIVSPVVR